MLCKKLVLNFTYIEQKSVMNPAIVIGTEVYDIGQNSSVPLNVRTKFNRRYLIQYAVYMGTKNVLLNEKPTIKLSGTMVKENKAGFIIKYWQ